MPSPEECTDALCPDVPVPPEVFASIPDIRYTNYDGTPIRSFLPSGAYGAEEPAEPYPPDALDFVQGNTVITRGEMQRESIPAGLIASWGEAPSVRSDVDNFVFINDPESLMPRNGTQYSNAERPSACNREGIGSQGTLHKKCMADPEEGNFCYFKRELSGSTVVYFEHNADFYYFGTGWLDLSNTVAYRCRPIYYALCLTVDAGAPVPTVKLQNRGASLGWGWSTKAFTQYFDYKIGYQEMNLTWKTDSRVPGKRYALLFLGRSSGSLTATGPATFVTAQSQACRIGRGQTFEGILHFTSDAPVELRAFSFFDFAWHYITALDVYTHPNDYESCQEIGGDSYVTGLYTGSNGYLKGLFEWTLAEGAAQATTVRLLPLRAAQKIRDSWVTNCTGSGNNHGCGFTGNCMLNTAGEDMLWFLSNTDTVVDPACWCNMANWGVLYEEKIKFYNYSAAQKTVYYKFRVPLGTALDTPHNIVVWTDTAWADLGKPGRRSTEDFCVWPYEGAQPAGIPDSRNFAKVADPNGDGKAENDGSITIGMVRIPPRQSAVKAGEAELNVTFVLCGQSAGCIEHYLTMAP